MGQRLSRRGFLVAAESSLVAAGGAVILGGSGRAGAAVVPVSRVDAVPTGVTRTWLAPQYWANRLADWRLANGRIEALTAGDGGRTVGVLTRQVAAGDVAGSVQVRTGTLATGTGFSGFLVGAGGGGLHWKAAALVMAASGQGGGLLATYDGDGNVRFREHTNEDAQFAYAEQAATSRSGPAPARTLGEDVLLTLDIVPVGAGRFDLVLTATRFDTGAVLSKATRAGVAGTDLVGGLSLISTPRAGGSTARHWFRELSTGGAKISVHNRPTGPVLGVLYSLSGSVLKLSAQFMPIGAGDPQQAVLQRRPAGASTGWATVQTTPIGAGYLALFRVTGWDATRAWDYRISWAVGTAQQAYYTGTVRADPRTKPSFAVAMVNCTIHSYRNLDIASSGAARLPGETFRGLYTSRNLYFPYAELATNITRQNPDLLVAFGDQFYENVPTAVDTSQPVLDMLSRYYLWLWSFADITRNTPTICLVDDHDVYHPNLYGWSGQPAPDGNSEWGGYVMPAGWVNIAQRMQCAHNPDPYDPTPVLQGISVYYTAFSYGGVSFAVLEDRKFKNTNHTNTDPAGNPLPLPRDLLGARQESFLRAWAGMHPGQPKVCLTQTVFGCVQTSVTGGSQRDPDSNGTPVPARRTAVRLLKDAHALVLSGDQHVGTLVRHGLDSFTDGPVQFTPPAAGTAWQRWFQPATPLPNPRGDNTGDFTDGYGNKFRVLAVANPKVTFAQVRAIHPNNNVGDRNLKREGYGITRIDKTAGSYRIECWPWQTDPSTPGATQFPGWPYTLAFTDV